MTASYAKEQAEHPATKMSVELRSVEVPIDGWQRCFQCQICGKVKIGCTGKTLTIRGVWYCNGLSVKNKAQEWRP